MTDDELKSIDLVCLLDQAKLLRDTILAFSMQGRDELVTVNTYPKSDLEPLLDFAWRRGQAWCPRLRMGEYPGGYSWIDTETAPLLAEAEKIIELLERAGTNA